MSGINNNTLFGSFRIDLDEKTIDPNEFSFWILILALTSFLAWGVFIVLYFSRVVGIFLTFFLDKYLRLSKNGVYFRIGGISISGLHVGKIMFRNVVYANNDFVVKINDGYFIFKFWKTIKSRRLKLDEKRSPRLLVSLNGFQIHVFNNMAKYSEIARICGADWFFANTGVDPKRPPKPPDSTPPSAVWENVWNLLGMLDLRISSGWLLAGNRLLPNALWLRLENLSCKIGVSESANDRALLTCEGDTESVSISLIKNEEYQHGENDKDPPRTTGDTGFPVLQTASLQFVLEQDILGYVVDEEQQSIDAKVPKWSSEWKFHNNTVISYGPWAEQQRMLIYNFFFPPDYQNAKTTNLPKRGQKRIHVRHDAKVILMKESCVDLWFERGEQLESIRTRCAPGSFIDFSVLWIVTDNGFHWNVHAEFLKIESTTSLLFTKLLESEKFVVKGSFEYPKVFNAEQNWKIDYTFSKATCWFVWDHKRFFTDLINDWVGDEPADIIKFIPFRVHNTLIVKDSFEILLLLNECNWVDPADKNAENVEAAIVGQELIFEFVMPFVEFLPEFVRVKYSMRAKGELAMRMKYPPDSATAPMLAALARSARTRSFAKKSSQGTHSCNKDEWFETWRTKSISMKFDHSYHPIVGKIKSQLPEQVEREFLPPKPDHPWKCAPDQLTVDIFIDGSEMKFTGLLVKLILELKNNYFGWYDSMTNIDSYPEDVTKVKSAFNRVPPNANPENYRPMDVDVSVRVCNTRALMLVYSPAMDASQENCPVVLAEEIVVEVKKSTTQSLIQVGTSPIAAYFDSAAADRPAGCLTLSGVQFRGQAMYSSKDVAWDMGLIEYGWLMEVLVGDLAGTLDFPHHLMALHQIVETILILALSPDDEKIVPVRMQFCQHGQLSRACTMSKTIGGTCETEERQKYRQLRVAVDSVHLSLGEDKTLFDVTIDPMRFTLCNAHESKFTEHLCLRLPKISVRQAYLMNEKTERNRWIQCASVEIAGVSLDVELPPESGDRPDHEKVRKEFVCGHDEASKRLHFLWEKQTVWGCACYGNTFFFGSNDSIGSIFLDCAPGSKLFVPGIEKDPKSQPKVLQSVLNKESSMLLGQSHNFYKQTRAKEQAYMAQRRSSEDTTSFHSAFSQQLYGTRLTNSNELMTTYGEFIHNLTIYPTEPIMPPYFSQPGAIESWCKAHQPPDFILDQEKQGVNEVHLTAKNKAPSARISSPAVRKSQPNDTQEEFESPNVRTKSPHQLHKQRRVSVNGVAASSVNIFFSPLALEACERLLTTTTNAISGTNPCLLVQMCYRDCVLRKHRQPLIEPLFSDDETPTELDIAVDLPQIRMGLFQCGFRKHLSTNMVNDETITANLALVLVDRAWILSKTVATTEMPTTMYQLNFNVLTAQLLQLTRRDGPDFSGHGSVTTCVNWDSCAIASRMKNCEPRVVLDFNVPDVSILLERKAVLVQAHARPLATTPVQTPTTPVNLNSPAEKPSRLSAVFGGASAEKAAEKVQPPSTPTPQASQKKAPLRVLRLSHEHVVRVVVGSVNASVVMARPQEMTAGDEFPIYEALSPVIISWLSVVDNFVYVVEKLAHDLECWRNVAMAKILKLALDCTDDKVAVKCGKNRMLAVKVLGKHQASCASCLLLHTLFRWFAYSQAAPIAQCSSICIRNEFEPSRTRKTALMALLSHWQPDIGRHLKLVSYDEASKFKVNRIPGKKRENSADEISIDSKNGKKETKKETKIIVEEPKGLRNSLEKLTPPMLRRRGNRKKGGQDEEDDGGAILEEGFDQTPGQTYVPPVFIEKMHAEHEDMSRKKFEEFDRMMEMDDESSNDGTSRMTNAQNNEPKVDEQKMDLYTWMRNAQKEKPYRAKAAGENILSEVDAAKDYVNPMDIQQKAFFYSLYRWARLEWFALDDVVVDRISMEYSAILKEIDVKMLAKRVKSSTDQSRQFITPAQHQVMLLRNAVVSGQLLWQLERDEKRRLPLSGKWTVNYTGNVENVRFLIGLATVSLGKELSLVLQAASEAHAEMKKLVAVARTPRINRMPPIVYAQAAEWDDKVLEMTRDYEKHLQRMTKSDQEAKVQTVVNGTVSVTSVMLESMLTDLYVSVMIHKIDLSQSKRPPEAIRSQTSVTNTGANVTASHDDKKATLTRKQTTPISVSASHIDDILLSLSRASLTLSEADSASKKSDIFRCTLNTSSLNFYRRLKSNSVRNKQPKNAKGDGRNSKIETWITLKFGALDGVMPMAAHSLHDVVMRHGKELEQQLNRLAAQPAGTTPTTTPTVDSATVLKPRSSVQEEESTQKPTPQQSMPPSHEAFSILQPIPATSSTTTALFSHRRTPSAAFPHPQQLALNRRTPIAVVNFVLDVASIEMNIQLLPSLQAKYRINRASSAGVTGNQANWNVIIDEHFFEFCVTAMSGQTETFRLQLPSVKCFGKYTVEQGTDKNKPSTDKKLLYREGGFLQTTVVLGHVNHTFTTDLLNQLLFAEQSFRSEFTSLINRIRPSVSPSRPQKSEATTADDPAAAAAPASKPPLLFSIKLNTKDVKMGKEVTPWLQLTASTPTHTAVRFTIDNLEGELTNKWVVKEEGSKERIYGNAVVHFNAKLGQLVKAAQYDEVSPELQEYATFMTQVRVENKDRNMLNSSYSYHISLNRPILLVKANAIDKAILLWLNYKNTYDYWRSERNKVVQEVKIKQEPSQNTVFSPPIQDVDMNLSLAINNGMYMCMPLYTCDVTEGMPALVISLQKSELSVLVKRELSCKASFESFKLSFIDDFDEQALSESFREATGSMQTNYFYFPQGRYTLCSKATAIGGPAKWVLSVCAEMKGVVIDLDQRIGKLAKMLVNTFSIFGEDEDDGTSLFDEHRELDSDEEKIEGAAEFANLRVEERIPWMENKMHERSRAVFDLVSRGASQKKLEAETQKLRQLELIRFKEFRRTMVEKWQKRGQASTPRSHQRPRRDSILSTKAKEVVSNVTGKHARPANTPQPVVEEIRDLETVNFNVTVKVSIDSGNCTLRTAKQEGAVPMTFGGKIGETLAAVNRGTRDIKAMFEQPNMTTTTFSIPSLEIKANHVSDQTDAMAKATADRFQSYASQGRANSSREAMEETRAENAKMKVGEEPKPKGAPRTTNSPSAFSPMRKVTPQKAPKRGCFYLFIGLSSMPTETVVTPHLATYLEQVLEPLPPSSVFRSSQADPENEQSRANSPVSHDNNIVAMDTAALPMDVMFYLDVQSSTIRFDGKKPSASGRSQSAVDCLLTLPRLTVELTTRRTDEDGYVGGMDISGQFKGFLLSIYSPHQDPTAAGALKLSLDTLLFVISRSKNSSSEADNRVRFVLTSQIGKASFEYDMRRLGELIQFPKPWYRAAIARRVFFGDQSAPRHRDDNSDTATARSHFHSAQAASKKDTTTNSASNTSVATHIPKPWYASVLVAVQWKEFDVFAQMSNTMGKTTWKARKGRLSGNAKLNSKLERDINVKFKLGSSELRAREGAISGDICFNTLVLSASHTLYADVAKPPKNEGKFDLRWISATVEWMSRRVFLAKWTQPSLVASDYHLAEKNSEKKRLAALGVNVRSSWDDLQVVIMRTTIDDLKSIVLKLTTFFQEQLKNSRIMWGIMDTSLKKPPIREQPSMPKTNLWEKIIDYVSEMQLREQLMGLMEKDGIAVGGNVDLNAGKISLVLMQGDMNSNCWAVFHLREAGIAFSPQARLSYMNEEYDHLGILLTQKFILRLGKEKKDRVENMANVCRVQTRHNLSRQQASIDSVLEYLISDVLKVTGLHVNPEHDADILQEVAAKNLRADPKAMSSATSLRTAAGTPPLPLPKDHKGLVTSKSAHSVLELFQFPALEAVMTSRQLNGVDEGEGYAEIMKSVMEVYSTFVCDFHDEVAIETDFNAQVSFLPELLKSYLNEPRLTGSTTSSSCESLTAKETSSDPRVFICEKWIVEPKMRFIDRIKWKPPVVDEILRKLQIFDHRNTIPKVIQRAVLDPLDTVLAGAVIAALHLVDTQHTIAAFKRSRAPEAPSSNEGQPEASAPSMALPALRPLSLSMTPSAAERTKHQRARSDGRKFQH